jgi:hypothetical protein
VSSWCGSSRFHESRSRFPYAAGFAVVTPSGDKNHERGTVSRSESAVHASCTPAEREFRIDELPGPRISPAGRLPLCRRGTSSPSPFRSFSLHRAAAHRVLQPPLMLVRSFFGLSLFLFATGLAPSASAQTPPPTDPPREPPATAPGPTLDATVIIEVDAGDANVQLDEKPIAGGASARRVSVSAGHHVVEVHIAGRPPIRREVDVGAGGTAGVVLHVVPSAPTRSATTSLKRRGPRRRIAAPLLSRSSSPAPGRPSSRSASGSGSTCSRPPARTRQSRSSSSSGRREERHRAATRRRPGSRGPAPRCTTSSPRATGTPMSPSPRTRRRASPR